MLARATCRSPDVVEDWIKLTLVHFFCSILAQYFGELHLDTLIEFLYFLWQIYSVTAGIHRVVKLSAKPKILRVLVFINSLRFQIWYLEIEINIHKHWTRVTFQPRMSFCKYLIPLQVHNVLNSFAGSAFNEAVSVHVSSKVGEYVIFFNIYTWLKKRCCIKLINHERYNRVVYWDKKKLLLVIK